MLKFNFRVSNTILYLYACIAVVLILAFQGYWIYSGYYTEKQQIKESLTADLREYVIKKDFMEILSVTNEGVRLSITPDLISKEVKELPIKRFEVGVKIIWDDASPFGSELVKNLFNSMLQSYQSPQGHVDDSKSFLDGIKDKYPSILLSLKRTKDNKSIVYFPQKGREDAMLITVPSEFNNSNSYTLMLYNANLVIAKKMAWLFVVSLLYLFVCLSAVLMLLKSIKRNRLLIESKDNFTSNMTHELKTPLSTLSAAVEALHKYNFIDDRDVAHNYLTLMTNDIKKLDSLTTSIMTNAGLKRNELLLEYQDINLKELVTEAIARFSVFTDRLTFDFSIDIAPDIMIQGDKLHLSNVLSNLIDNALKYNNGNVLVKIHAGIINDTVSVFISDNGIGIEPAYHKEIFKPYYRVAAGNIHTVKGFGIGLTYAAEVMRLHKGKIRLVYSEKGKGSEFEIQLRRQK